MIQHASVAIQRVVLHPRRLGPLPTFRRERSGLPGHLRGAEVRLYASLAPRPVHELAEPETKEDRNHWRSKMKSEAALETKSSQELDDLLLLSTPEGFGDAHRQQGRKKPMLSSPLTLRFPRESQADPSANPSHLSPPPPLPSLQRTIKTPQAFARHVFTLLKDQPRGNPHSFHQIIRHHSSNRHLISTSSYNFLLAYAYRVSNFSAARDILRDMDKERVPWDSDTRVALLYGVMKSRAQLGSDARREIIKERRSQWEGDAEAFSMEDMKQGHFLDDLRTVVGDPSDWKRIDDSFKAILLRGGKWSRAKSSAKSKTPKSLVDRDFLSSVLKALLEAVPSTFPSGLTTQPFKSGNRSDVPLQAPLPPLAIPHILPTNLRRVSPGFFLALLRYCLAGRSHIPPLPAAAAALTGLSESQGVPPAKHLLRLLHLYLHRSVVPNGRPLPLVTSFFEGHPSVTPTRATLVFALTSLRNRKHRQHQAKSLIEWFRGKWGDDILSEKCWRLVLGYALDCKSVKIARWAKVRRARWLEVRKAGRPKPAARQKSLSRLIRIGLFSFRRKGQVVGGRRNTYRKAAHLMRRRLGRMKSEGVVRDVPPHM